MFSYGVNIKYWKIKPSCHFIKVLQFIYKIVLSCCLTIIVNSRIFINRVLSNKRTLLFVSVKKLVAYDILNLFMNKHFITIFDLFLLSTKKINVFTLYSKNIPIFSTRLMKKSCQSVRFLQFYIGVINTGIIWNSVAIL